MLTIKIQYESPDCHAVFPARKLAREGGRVVIWETDNEHVVRELTTGVIYVMNDQGKTVDIIRLT